MNLEITPASPETLWALPGKTVVMMRMDSARLYNDDDDDDDGDDDDGDDDGELSKAGVGQSLFFYLHDQLIT